MKKKRTKKKIDSPKLDFSNFDPESHSKRVLRMNKGTTKQDLENMKPKEVDEDYFK